jgi:hypothetical protein
MRTDLILFGKHFKMASRTHRRRLVLLFYVVFAALISASWFIDPSGFGAGFFTIEFTIFVGPILGGYLCGWFKPFNVGLVKPFGGNEVQRYAAKRPRSAFARLFYPAEGFPGIQNDERDLSRRDHAHFLAYRVLGGIVMLAFLIEFLGTSKGHLLGVLESFVPRAIYLLLQAGYVLAFTLPPAILLWNEPDMEAPE